MGTAYAQSILDKTPPTYFLEINLRDQWDHGHFFVTPGLATDPNLRKGETSKAAALFFTQTELRLMANNIYLTEDSMELAPYVDTIAMIDCCQLPQGAIHGHEAANPLRSPGRSYSHTANMLPMYNNDATSNFPQGVEAYYYSTPTPATLHNHLQKEAAPTLHNGYAFKGAGRSVHTTYHFAANLPNAELDRFHSPQALINAFASSPTQPEIIPNAKDAQILTSILQWLDKRCFERQASISATTAQVIK